MLSARKWKIHMILTSDSDWSLAESRVSTVGVEGVNV